MSEDTAAGTAGKRVAGREDLVSAREVEWVVVALGSNQGKSTTLLREAMNRIERLAGQPLLRSALWRTAPVDCPPGSADFLNAVVTWMWAPSCEAGASRSEGVASLDRHSASRPQSPETLLAELQAIEREFGRRPKQAHNEARPLDLDLIAYGAERRETVQLTLPHPRAAERAFVLYPLAEILPDLVLPGQARTVRELRDGLGGKGSRMAVRLEG